MQPPSDAQNTPIPLSRAISKSNRFSRSRGKLAIKNGRVRVNGRVVTDNALPVSCLTDVIEIDDQVVTFDPPYLYFAFHKPAGVITTTIVEKNSPDSPYLSEYFQDLKTRVYPCGRLDKDSEGLILVTNDPFFLEAITNPKHKIEKEYLVTVREKVTPAIIKALETGLTLRDGTKYQGCRVKKVKIVPPLHPPTPKELFRPLPWTELNLILTEGKYREIRKMFLYFRMRVRRLVRLRVGPVQLSDLTQGQYRALTLSEIWHLKNAV